MKIPIPIRVHVYLWSNGYRPETVADVRCTVDSHDDALGRLDIVYDQVRHALATAVTDTPRIVNVCMHLVREGKTPYGTQQNFPAGGTPYWRAVDRMNGFWLEHRQTFAQKAVA